MKRGYDEYDWIFTLMRRSRTPAEEIGGWLVGCDAMAGQGGMSSLQSRRHHVLRVLRIARVELVGARLLF